MLTRSRLVGFVVAAVGVALSAGCATQRGVASPGSMASPVSMNESSAPSAASLAGVWEGEVWERPVHYLQGVRRITLNIARDGRWTASSAGKPCASGTVGMRGNLVVLGGDRTGPDYCMPYSLASRDGHMKAVFETSFKERPATAMIDLERVRPALPEAAEAQPGR